MERFINRYAGPTSGSITAENMMTLLGALSGDSEVDTSAIGKAGSLATP